MCWVIINLQEVGAADGAEYGGLKPIALLTEWIITVGHRSKSEPKSSKAAQTAPNSDILAA